jgi:hypothetical protein
MSMDRLLTSRQSLCEALQARNVVLVVGPDAMLVDVNRADGTRGTVPLYQVVSDELLAAYGVQQPDRSRLEVGSAWLLHRAVAQILAESPGVSVERVRRSVSATVKSVSQRAVATPLVTRIAELRAFDLFICLTPDEGLVNALQRVLGDDHVAVSAYAPNADTSQPVDVPPPRPGSARVFFPLGRSASGPRVAIHEEDAFEFLYKFQEEAPRRAPNLLTELRSRDLLLLGCNLPDWLGRGFLRLANECRLSLQERKMEFFAADEHDAGLNSFLSRFDPNATVFPWSPEEFVTELTALVQPANPNAIAPQPPAAPTPRAGHSPTVFVSYASEDVESARRLADALGRAGFGDVWLDKRQLIAGDDWSDRIDEAIEQCDFFMPVLSRNADRRREGVFWEEWRRAVSRAMRVNDTFLLPVGVDTTPPDRAGYERIFSGFSVGFRELHLLHAPDGVLSDDGTKQLEARCSSFKGESR